jgi:hypothetical protein
VLAVLINAPVNRFGEYCFIAAIFVMPFALFVCIVISLVKMFDLRIYAVPLLLDLLGTIAVIALLIYISRLPYHPWFMAGFSPHG